MDSRPKLDGLPLATAVAALYAGWMSLLWIVTGFAYDQPTAVDQLLLSVGLLPLIAILLLVQRFASLPAAGVPVPGRARWMALAGVASFGLPLFGLPFAIRLSEEPLDRAHFALTLVGCLLVGVGEELAFRRIALEALLRRLSVPIAVAVDGALFGMLHLANLAAGRRPQDVAIQVGITTILGTVLAWTYLFARRNLALVMLLHGVFDFGLAGAAVTQYGGNPIGHPILGAQIAAAVVLWGAGLKWLRKAT